MTLIAVRVQAPDLRGDGRLLESDIPRIVQRAETTGRRAGVAEARRAMRESGIFRRQSSGSNLVHSRPGWIRIRGETNLLSLKASRRLQRPKSGPGRPGVARSGNPVRGAFQHLPRNAKYTLAFERDPAIPTNKRFRGTGGIRAVLAPISRTAEKAS